MSGAGEAERDHGRPLLPSRSCAEGFVGMDQSYVGGLLAEASPGPGVRLRVPREECLFITRRPFSVLVMCSGSSC